MQFTRVLALYDPFGVDVPLKFDITHTLTHFLLESSHENPEKPGDVESCSPWCQRASHACWSLSSSVTPNGRELRFVGVAQKLQHGVNSTNVCGRRLVVWAHQGVNRKRTFYPVTRIYGFLDVTRLIRYYFLSPGNHADAVTNIGFAAFQIIQRSLKKPPCSQCLFISAPTLFRLGVYCDGASSPRGYGRFLKRRLNCTCITKWSRLLVAVDTLFLLPPVLPMLPVSYPLKGKDTVDVPWTPRIKTILLSRMICKPQNTWV